MDITPSHVSLETRYEQREGLELAFVAALKRLATQSAMLILREVIGFSENQVAKTRQSLPYLLRAIGRF